MKSLKIHSRKALISFISVFRTPYTCLGAVWTIHRFLEFLLAKSLPELSADSNAPESIQAVFQQFLRVIYVVLIVNADLSFS